MLMLMLRILECEPGIHKHKCKHKEFSCQRNAQKLNPGPLCQNLSAENMATQVNEKLEESVGNYPRLYDKKSADFKTKTRKKCSRLCLCSRKVSLIQTFFGFLCVSLCISNLLRFLRLNSSNNPISTSLPVSFVSER